MRVISSFWTLFGSLVAVGSLLGDFLEPFGNLSGKLLENVSKTIQKVTKVHKKSAKGVPQPSPRRPSQENWVGLALQKDAKTE